MVDENVGAVVVPVVVIVAHAHGAVDVQVRVRTRHRVGTGGAHPDTEREQKIQRAAVSADEPDFLRGHGGRTERGAAVAVSPGLLPSGLPSGADGGG